MRLRDVPTGSADLVVGDAFGGRAVPYHLTTREFVEAVRRVLRDDGVYAQNIIDQAPLRFLAADVATLRAVFAHVAVHGGNAFTRVLVAERLRLVHGVSTLLIEPDADLDRATTLILSGRTDLVGVPA